MPPLSCFKAYDIRGRLGSELNADIARRIGRAFAEVLGARRVMIGRDARASSQDLMEATIAGLIEAGVEVLELGLCGSEEIYAATSHFKADGGIAVTASHNPMEYNGMKLVRAGSAPIAAETGLAEIRALAESGAFPPPRPGGRRRQAAGARAAYVARVLSFVDPGSLPPLTLLVNAGNGAAGPTFDAIAAALRAGGAPLRFVRMHHDPDGGFPNGIPNPLLPENQPVTGDAVCAHRADFGVAWDGDFDRCFLFDAEGRFVPGEYVVGLLAEAFLARHPGARIVHDPRVIWNTRDVITAGGGQAIQARTGHAFFKQALRDTGAIYGGEMSAHHYFRDFYCCDSGMIPWLLVADLIGRRGLGLSALLAERIARFPSSGEINFRPADPARAIAQVGAALGPGARSIDETDGLALDMGGWRLSLRASNTEALLRLNIEAQGDAGLVAAGVARVRALIEG